MLGSKEKEKGKRKSERRRKRKMERKVSVSLFSPRVRWYERAAYYAVEEVIIRTTSDQGRMDEGSDG